jgi:hypothetical protein
MGDFSRLNGKTFPYLTQNEQFFEFKRKFSVYFSGVGVNSSWITVLFEEGDFFNIKK